jgi:hypothetical protein
VAGFGISGVELDFCYHGVSYITFDCKFSEPEEVSDKSNAVELRSIGKYLYRIECK